MMRDFRYTGWPDRGSVIDYLQKNISEKKIKSVIDIGASATSWSCPYVTHYVDVCEWAGNSDKKAFLGSATSIDTWEKIMEWVKFHGKFDFCICSHTLEDISNPQLVCSMMPKIAKSGYVAFPSKFAELIRHPGQPFLGWIHHRWIFNKEGEKLVAYPKLTFLEYKDWSSLQSKPEASLWELQFFWDEDFVLHTVNEDYMGPSQWHVEEYFKRLLD